MDVTFGAGGWRAACGPLPNSFFQLAAMLMWLVTGAPAGMLHHEVKAMFETGDTIR